MKELHLGVSLAALAALGGCNEASCPPDYPVERDGACYRAGDGGAPMDAGGVDGGAADGGGGGADAGMEDGGASCNGEHPLFDATRRWCDPGCYCSTSDACFAADVADACCDVDVVCGPPAMPDGGVTCNGTHPLVRTTPPTRYCAPGTCSCGDLAMDPPLDVGYPMDVADACCPVAIVCD